MTSPALAWIPMVLFGIGAAFWGLVFGFTASWLIERLDFPGRPDGR